MTGLGALAGLDDTDLRRVLAPFEPGVVEDVYELSPLQSGILFHALHRPDRSDYLSQNAYRLTGSLDQVSYIEAWQRAVDRHPALRTTFAWDGIAHPVQLVHGKVPVSPRCLDWRGRDEESVARSLAELMARARGAGMRLDRTPPMAFDLIGVSDDDRLFVWHLHHILADGWSLAIVLDEVYAIYAELTGGPAASLPPAVPYRQHIAWLGDRDHHADLAFWKSNLAGFGAATALPIIGPAPAAGQGAAVKVARLVTAETAQRLRQLARGQRITLNAVLQGAWALLLSRHSGDQDVLHGTIMSGRSGDEPEIECMVGMLVNTVPVRLAIDDAAPLPSWLGSVQRRLNDVRRYEHVGLADVRGCSQLRPGENMFDTVLNFVSYAGPAAGPSEGLTVAAERAYEQTGYPLGLTVVSRGDLLLQFAYEPDRVEPADAECFFSRYEHMLGQFAAATQRTLVGDITALPDDERRLVTRDWAGAVGDYPMQATVGELFEAMAASQPEAAALVGADLAGRVVELTYAQLDAAANRLARVLRARGVSVDQRVAIALPRSADLVVALLAIVKAGGACLGLDPANPLARLALMIADSDPVIIIASADAARDLRAVTADRTILVIDDPAVAQEIAAMPAGPLDQVATPLSLAHICYTSGSSGTPKGVGLIHRGVIRLAYRPSYLRTGPGETFLQLQPIAFDGSLVELYGTLLNGARLAVPQPGKLDIPEIAALLRHHGVTALALTTAMFHQMVEYDIGALAGVRQMITGGDVLLPDSFTAPLRIYPGMTVIAAYGPTENTTITTAIAVDDPGQIGSRVPIGRPIPHTTVYILDEKMRPVPVGVTGELYTGGHGIARGYLNHPATTADRFVPDPFSAEPGGRLYRTGDLARWRANGVLDFLGRIDGQVKIRGFRIELGEIEARLSQHQDVAEAVVEARQDANGHKRLVAYLVAAGGSAPSAAQIKKFVKQELPEYMVPSAVVTLDAMPMSVNGKVDRAALPDPAGQAGDFGGMAPRTPAEKTLTNIWQRILGSMEIGIKDNFFDLGGDSILSIQIASEARASGLPLTSALLFSHQSIEELAEALAETPPMDPPEQGRVTGDVALTPIQSAFLQGGGPHERFTQSALLRWSGRVDPDVLRGALGALLAHHDALRLRITRADGAWSLHLPEAAGQNQAAHLDVIDLPELAQDAIDAVIDEAADRVHGGMDLTAGPMLRAALFRLGGGRADHVLIAIHHLAADSASWGFVLADLNAAYRALAAGASPALPAKTTSVKAWAQELRRLADSADLDLDLRYWRESAHQAEPLPVDDEPGTDTESATRSISVALSPGETDALLNGLGYFGGIRAVDLLVAGLARTLSEWTGGKTVTLDFASHGRDSLSGRADTSRTAGWFTSVYPVSFTLPDAGDLNECLHTVREQLRAVPRHGIAFGIARQLSSREPGNDSAPPASLPAGQVSFSYLGRQAAQLPDDALFTLEPFTWGREVDPRRPRPYLLDIVACTSDGKLTVTWRYSERTHRGATISGLADRFIDQVRLAIRHVANAPEVAQAQRWRRHMFPGTALAIAPMARYRIPGASFAIVTDGRIQAWARGVADAESGTPVTPQTVFQLGSISKHLTALAVLRLSQEGVVDLDADVNKYLSCWQLPQLDGAQPASLRHLLRHSVGLSPAEVRLYAPGEPMPSVAELLDAGLGPQGLPVRVTRAPGTAQEYSWINYVVIQLAITEITGLSFAGALAELVLDPLGMKDTSLAREFPAQRPAAAHGHTAAGRRYSNPWHDLPSMAAGGMWSTPADLARVAMEIQAAVQGNGTLFTRSSARQLLPDEDHGYGPGTVVKTVNGVRWYGHPGDSPGFRCLFAFTIDHGTAIAAFTNGDGGTQMLEDMLGGMDVDLIMRVQGDRKFT